MNLRSVCYYGDIQLIEEKDAYLSIACDSAGGIGNKSMDQLKLDPELVGYYTAFVPVVETIVARGEILSIIDTLCVEYNPTGRKIIEGILRVMNEIGLPLKHLTGSTEENMTSVATGIGVTVIGRISKTAMDKKTMMPGMMLILAGLPKVGEQFLIEEVVNKNGETLTLEAAVMMAKDERVIDMLPVGSKGIGYELEQFVGRQELVSGYKLKEEAVKDINLKQSAGPATCLILAVKSNHVDNVIEDYAFMPMTILGEVR